MPATVLPPPVRRSLGCRLGCPQCRGGHRVACRPATACTCHRLYAYCIVNPVNDSRKCNRFQLNRSNKKFNFLQRNCYFWNFDCRLFLHETHYLRSTPTFVLYTQNIFHDYLSWFDGKVSGHRPGGLCSCIHYNRFSKKL
jgi:hypothetical protein